MCSSLVLNSSGVHVNGVRLQWSTSDSKLQQMAEETGKGDKLQSALQMVAQGWPRERSKVPENLLDLFPVRAELSSSHGLLLRGSRIVIPSSMRQEFLDKIHDGHQGITKCRERAASSVWWPGINDAIKTRISTCQHCQSRPSQKSELLIPSELPERPFQKVGADLFQKDGKHYLAVIHYFSRYLDIAHLPSTSSTTVITRMKNIFAQHGIPEAIFTDNGSQLVSKEYIHFSEQWGFKISTSSPYFAQSNGEVERGVQIAKRILEQEDPFLALLSYRATPTSPTGVSPAELAMGRKLRTTLPCLSTHLLPKKLDRDVIEARDKKSKERNKKY